MAKSKRICSIESCGNPHYGKGYCRAHYQRSWGRKTTDPDLIKVKYARRGGKPSVGHEDFLRSLIGTDVTDCITWPFTKDKDGYGRAVINRRHITASRAICIMAYGPPARDGLHAAHSCGKGHLGCVNPNHIRWATPKENQHDRIAHGTSVVDARWSRRQLTEDQVRHIRRLAKSLSHEGLAKRFGVSTSTISDINTRKTWKWLK